MCGNKAAVFHQWPINIKDPFTVSCGVDYAGKSMLILTIIRHDKEFVLTKRGRIQLKYIYTSY
jgi:hypothetical protein